MVWYHKCDKVNKLSSLERLRFQWEFSVDKRRNPFMKRVVVSHRCVGGHKFQKKFITWDLFRKWLKKNAYFQ
jgi:hypothetical protein